MTDKYSITDFRINLRRAFNQADEGHKVLIERYGQLYGLHSLKKNASSVTIATIPTGVDLDITKGPDTTHKATSVELGHKDHPNFRRFCGEPGCPYA